MVAPSWHSAFVRGQGVLVVAAAIVVAATPSCGGSSTAGSTGAGCLSSDFRLVQQPAAWAERFGDEQRQLADGVAVDAEGNVVLTGQVEGNLDFGTGPVATKSPTDRFLARLSPDGKAQWSKSIGDLVGALDMSLVAAARDGSSIVAGSAGASSAMPWSDIAGFDATGALRWHRTLMDPSWVMGHGGQSLVIQGLAADAMGGSVLCGYYGGTFDFGTGPQATAGLVDGVIVSLDPAGVTRWVRHFGSAGTDTFVDDVAFDSAGNAFVAGAFGGTIDLGTGPLVNPDSSPGAGLYIFVAAFDPAGKALWARSFGGAARQKAGTIVATADHGVVIGGWVDGSLDFDGHSISSATSDHTTDEMYVARLDPTGHATWARPIGTQTLPIPSVALDSQEDILIAGLCAGATEPGGQSWYVAKLDSTGIPQWGTIHHNVRWSGIGADPMGHVIVGGSIQGAADIGGISLQSAGGSLDVAVASLMP
jgi:hypothetical protein